MLLSPSLLESCGLSLSISPSHSWLPSFSRDSASSELFLACAVRMVPQHPNLLPGFQSPFSLAGASVFQLLFNFLTYYFWLHWVCVARGLSLVAVSRAAVWLWCLNFSLWYLLLLQSLGLCTVMTLRVGMRREMGGRIRMGNTCTPMADSCECMAKTTTIL